MPQVIGCDDELRVIEMTIVGRPFVLDLAAAYLDRRPEFADDVWADWESGKEAKTGCKPALHGPRGLKWSART